VSDSTNTPTVVLVHGGFADASFWAPVIEDLQAHNVPVLVPPNPLRGLVRLTAHGQHPHVSHLSEARNQHTTRARRRAIGTRMTAMPSVEPLDEQIDHVRGPTAGRVVLEYGDYECPYSRRAFREIARIEGRPGSSIRFAFRHFPLTEIHPHALAAAAAAEAAALQDRFWEMHELLFHRHKELDDEDLQRYAAEVGLDVSRFNRDRSSPDVARRIERDVKSGLASGEVRGTPTLFIDGIVHLGGYDAATLTQELTR
jgi:2-hydroxychromene-2-carboxylate isomerase